MSFSTTMTSSAMALTLPPDSRPCRSLAVYAYLIDIAVDATLWTYLTTPFLLTIDGVRVEEMEPWREGAETWSVLRAYFPGSIETHSLVQDFFFGEDLLLRRHDYTVTIAGGFAAAQLTSDYTEADGIRLPTKRLAYARAPDRQPIRDLLMVSIDVGEVRFE
jgi:hypothetical protein